MGESAELPEGGSGFSAEEAGLTGIVAGRGSTDPGSGSFVILLKGTMLFPANLALGLIVSGPAGSFGLSENEKSPHEAQDARTQCGETVI